MCILQGFFYENDRFILLQYMWLYFFKLICFLIYLTLSNVYAGESVKVATASNFLWPLKNLKAQFKILSGHDLIISSGSTTKLYAQIMNGAPYDVFLAADQSTTRNLIENGQAIANSEFIYATGKLALWGADKDRSAQGFQNDLQNFNFRFLAIANPKLAPYGRAALEVIENLELKGALNSRLVYGENIGQAFQFVYSGNADLGFVAVSQLMLIKDAGHYWEIPLYLYKPLRQSAVLLNRARNNIAAKSFLDFLKGYEIQKVISNEYGYLSTTQVKPER